MFTFLFEHFFLIIALTATLFLPGWFFLTTLERYTQSALFLFERAVLAVPISFGITTSLLLLGGHLYALTPTAVLVQTAVTTLVLLILATIVCQRIPEAPPTAALYTFTRTQGLFFMLLIALTIGIKTIYLTNTIFPTATDLGHHLYWVEHIMTHHEIPVYQKTHIISGDTPSFAEPERVADFIIGEHLIFAAIGMLSTQSILSAFPSLVLFVVSIVTTLTLFILARRLFARSPFGMTIALASLLVAGPLYTLSGSGAKFVSGGVIGNIFGNLLIPTVLYFLYRTMIERRALWLSLSIFMTTALIYTHHLSAFLLAYILFFVALFYALLLWRTGALTTTLRAYAPLTRSKGVWAVCAGILFFLLAVHLPSYIDPSAISSSVGAPSKSTRTGVSWDAFIAKLGHARFVLGMWGVASLVLFFRSVRYRETAALLLGWCAAMTVASTAPEFLKINIISSRIANYAVAPSMLLAGLGLVTLLYSARRDRETLHVPQLLHACTTGVVLLFLFADGLHDNADTLTVKPKVAQATQTFHAAGYLADVTPADSWIVKDHNYITADTWMKVFFTRDYSYPLSRSYFGRYESRPHREHCTLWMLSEPASERAETCFDALRVDTAVVETSEDAAQFLKLEDFDRVYQNDALSVFVKQSL